MADSILRDLSKDFAQNIVFLCRRLRTEGIEFSLVNQLLRCGTSIGANIHEAQYAQGKKDFISKFEIALKECSECEYWLELLLNVGSLMKSDYDVFTEKCTVIRRMLISSVTTLKYNEIHKT